MSKNRSLENAKRVGTGLCFIIFPLTFVFAFAVHPGLLQPRILSPEELILRAHQNGLLQFAHVLVTLNTAVLAGWAGRVGASLAILGAVMLAADKGALCLTMSAFDTLPESTFALMMPGLLAMFSFKGWMVLVWGFLFLPIGFAIQSIALFKTKALPRWQSALFLMGVLFVGFPDGAEIINLTASILMAVALFPYGMRMVANKVPREKSQA
ncbi:MAG: hypothetical protein NTY16_11235 [Deltaproteobacteria bacterium]|nr:hypothetical protein [Deltaproteobacteria bacterium]